METFVRLLVTGNILIAVYLLSFADKIDYTKANTFLLWAVLLTLLGLKKK